MERETIGKLSSDLLQRDTGNDHSVGEQMQEQLSDYESNIHECISRGKNNFPNDFYIVVITKRERLMQNVLRHYFFPRLSCPTPDYDQAVYKYTRTDDFLEFLWVVPDRQAVRDIENNLLELDPSYRQLSQIVLDFLDGTLDKKARVLNNEPLIQAVKA